MTTLSYANHGPVSRIWGQFPLSRMPAFLAASSRFVMGQQLAVMRFWGLRLQAYSKQLDTLAHHRDPADLIQKQVGFLKRAQLDYATEGEIAQNAAQATLASASERTAQNNDSRRQRALAARFKASTRTKPKAKAKAAGKRALAKAVPKTAVRKKLVASKRKAVVRAKPKAKKRGSSLRRRSR